MTFSKETSLCALLMSVLFILVIDHVTLPTPTAFAGSNGQQVFFYCPTNPFGSSMMDYGIVRGNNQYGQYVEWQGSANWGTGYTYIFTEGWWWVGNIQLSWWVASTNKWWTAQTSVPEQQNGEVSNFKCFTIPKW
jgi:hypothetical protein